MSNKEKQEVRRVDDTLQVYTTLSSKERDECVIEATKRQDEIDSLGKEVIEMEANMKSMKDDIRTIEGNIAKKQTELRELLVTIKKNARNKPTKVTLEFNYTKATVFTIRNSDGRQIAQRAMTKAELQIPLDFTPQQKPKQEAEDKTAPPEGLSEQETREPGEETEIGSPDLSQEKEVP